MTPQAVPGATAASDLSIGEIVEASAGTGKTREVVERILDAIAVIRRKPRLALREMPEIRRIK